MDILGGDRLTADARLVAVIAERLGRDLPAGVAVDARVIDVELALHVLRQPTFELRHEPLYVVSAFRRTRMYVVSATVRLKPDTTYGRVCPGKRRARRAGPSH